MKQRLLSAILAFCFCGAMPAMAANENGGSCDSGGCNVKICTENGCVFYRCDNSGKCVRLTAPGMH